MLHSNLISLLITFVVALLWLRINDFAAHRGWISSWLSRKFIHIGTGPLFVLCWLLFPNTPSSPFIAALVPLVITLQFFLVGIGAWKDEAAVQAMSRTGDPREILRGPLYYGLIFVLLTVIFWYNSPTGIVALMLMCGGDGLAEILGRTYGKSRLPWNPQKTWIGSVGMFIGGFSLSILILAIFSSTGIFSNSLLAYLPATIIIAIIGTIVETFPLPDIDNITVAISAVISGFLLF